MYKKIIPVLLILLIAAGGAMWMMKKNNLHPFAKSYDSALDTIFFNLTFGMKRQAFYDTCWKLNKTGLFTSGSTNLSVQHEIMTGYGKPVSMNFYPNFSNDVLYEMPVTYNYEAWAPWNRELYSDTLIVKIVQQMEKDYNVKFTHKKTQDGRPAYYNYTYPRKILITVQDEQYVKVLMENEKYMTEDEKNKTEDEKNK